MNGVKYMEQAKLSVIIPIYNAEKYLYECLDSVIHQSMNEIEIILVNDGSTDKSLEICNEYASSDKRIKVITKENGGVHEARNIGLDYVTSDYFTYLESDDWLPTNACQCLYEMITTKNVDLFLSSYFCVLPSGIKEKTPYLEEEILFSKQDVLHRLMVDTLGLTDSRIKHPELIDSLLTCTAKIYKTDIARKNNILWKSRKETYSDCLDYLLRYMSVCQSAFYKRVPLYYYRRTNTSSQTATFRPGTLELWQRQFFQLEEFIKQNDLAFLMPAYYSRVCFTIIPIGGNAYRMNDKKKALKEINKALAIPEYSEAFKYFKIRSLPIKYRPLFYFAKHKMSLLFFYMTSLMRYAMSKR